MVVQLDVKKAFDRVDHRAAFQGNEITRCESVFDGIAVIWIGSCMKARLGTVLSSKVRMSRSLPQGAPESPVIFTMITELVLRDLIKSWITRKLAWRLDDFVLAAICCADGVVLVAASVAAAEVMVERESSPSYTHRHPKPSPPPTQQKRDVFTVMKKVTQATCECLQSLPKVSCF